MLKNLKQLIFSLKMKKKNRRRNNILLPGSNDLFFGLDFILWRKRHHVYSFISAVSGCMLLLLFASSVLTPPPAAADHFLSHHFSAVRKTQVVEFNFDKVFQVPASGGVLGRDLWSSSQSKFYNGCSNASKSYVVYVSAADMKTRPNRYLMIATSGGLNQQRTGIIDAVVVAYILNATLVIPKLDQHSYWKDSSDFAEIFNVDLFISSLERMLKSSRFTAKWRWLSLRSLIIDSQIDWKLIYKSSDAGELPCSKVHRPHSGNGFEPDMLAFSGCYFGGGEKEREDLGAIRKRWKTLHVSNPENVRRHGRCPLTPEEIGLMLRALGFGSDVHIYVASGEVYGGEETLTPLKTLFPNFHSKETVATKEELAPFSAFSGRMAALDYIVCDESDVFVTNNNGNMARILAGRRRYLGTNQQFDQTPRNCINCSWTEIHDMGRVCLQGSNLSDWLHGEPKEVKPGRGEFHENPHSCICEAKGLESSQDQTPKDRNNGVEVSEQEQQSLEEDPDWTDID
ncbi:hypothetical protein F3Y22_tig00009308pilonHSYRG00001 [Hibiscus syriacus]|uniref:O-fucosyltransferase family protein n=1 Tax=Hibiscus syriacus TaxID=106335 RepID=A0A6A3C6N2_HIBSY|nr:hypothetical protein F3Y22_tig00009308pilonHSYRG00001 [Hibiscus syriacus]